jgi:XTP/dITP diphosphohydrolase
VNGGSRTLVFATTNPGKLREVRELLAPDFDVLGTNDVPGGLPDVEETGTTFEANAILKARSACGATGKPALADDSGLEVDALDGRPGVLSARYGGAGLDDAGRRAALLAEMTAIPDGRRTARFVSVVALAEPGGRVRTARGTVEGRLIRESRGSGGFGYDPIFVPDGHDETFGELPPSVKNGISHRARALAIARGWF